MPFCLAPAFPATFRGFANGVGLTEVVGAGASRLVGVSMAVLRKICRFVFDQKKGPMSI